MNELYYKEYYQLERSHWWFKARLEILESLLKKKILRSNNQKLKILNAGVATGATTTMLEKYGTVTSLEYDKKCCTFLKQKLQIEVINASLTDLPFENHSFDLVCAFDVIEHIENDALAVEEIYRVLKKQGIVYLTVPAFYFLWSHHDVVNHHFRRYTLKELSNLISLKNFEIVYKSYFNTFLFLPIFLARRIGKFLKINTNKESSGSDFEKFKANGLVNRFLFYFFKTEQFFLTKNIKFPFGVSALIIGVKRTIRNN